jgi:type II secretory pathway component PulJ
MDDGQWSLVMDTTAGANVRSLTQLQKVNESGEQNMLRQGTLSNLMGFMLKESAQIAFAHQGHRRQLPVQRRSGAVGDTSINLDTGSGTVLAATF